MFDVVVVDDVIAGVLYKHEGHLLPTDVYFDRGRCKRRLIIFIVTYIASSRIKNTSWRVFSYNSPKKIILKKTPFIPCYFSLNKLQFSQCGYYVEQ